MYNTYVTVRTLVSAILALSLAFAGALPAATAGGGCCPAEVDRSYGATEHAEYAEYTETSVLSALSASSAARRNPHCCCGPDASAASCCDASAAPEPCGAPAEPEPPPPAPGAPDVPAPHFAGLAAAVAAVPDLAPLSPARGGPAPSGDDGFARSPAELRRHLRLAVFLD